MTQNAGETLSNWAEMNTIQALHQSSLDSLHLEKLDPFFKKTSQLLLLILKAIIHIYCTEITHTHSIIIRCFPHLLAVCLSLTSPKPHINRHSPLPENYKND
jgi:hypothetical protein